MTEVIETMIVEAEVTEAMIVEAEVVALIATMTIPMIKIFVAVKEVNLNIRSQTFKDREVDHQWTMAIEAEINMSESCVLDKSSFVSQDSLGSQKNCKNQQICQTCHTVNVSKFGPLGSLYVYF